MLEEVVSSTLLSTGDSGDESHSIGEATELGFELLIGEAGSEDVFDSDASPEAEAALGDSGAIATAVCEGIVVASG